MRNLNILRNIVHRLRRIYFSSLGKFKKFKTTDELIEYHFKTWSNSDHQNRAGLSKALLLLNQQPAVIVETGTSAYGTDSSRLFNAYVQSFGGTFASVDIRVEAYRKLKKYMSKSTCFYVADSVDFLNDLERFTGLSHADLWYLDSWDVDWYNPLPSALHGKSEYDSILPRLRPNDLIVIDDTPSEISWIPKENHEEARQFLDMYGALPGKGALAHIELIASDNVRVVHHSYNAVYQVL
jgi:hypothetical protein